MFVRFVKIFVFYVKFFIRFSCYIKVTSTHKFFQGDG